jgi:site-specific recombinase XerC
MSPRRPHRAEQSDERSSKRSYRAQENETGTGQGQIISLKKFRRHDLRHDFGSKLLRQTKSLKLVQEALHHSSIHVTAQFYAHVEDEELVAGRESIEASRKYTGIAPTEAKKGSKKS